MKRLILLLANGFGLGLAPVASGTFGTLPALLIVWLCWDFFEISWMWQIVLAVIFSLVAIPICDAAEKIYKTKDDGRIVADEYMTFPICMIGLPFEPIVVLMAFVSCRICDIIKPPPANGLQRVTGGLGIVIDDVFASLYSLGINHLLFFFFLR